MHLLSAMEVGPDAARVCIEPTHVFGLLFFFFLPSSYNIFLPVLLERNTQYLIYPEPGT